ncbi:7-deoxyloganetin glucosyltransferase-like [Wolffia australiana]
MGSISNVIEKPHAVCIAYPAQGHINPMMTLAKLLHSRGFHITFVNTEYNHRRLLKALGSAALDSVPDFQFKTIPDGLPPSDEEGTQDIPSLCESTMTNCLRHFSELLSSLNRSSKFPPVSCIVSDGVMSFTLDAAEEIGVPEILFWTTSACGFMAYLHYKELVRREIIPLKDESYLTNGYLDTFVDWIPGMPNIRLKDLPCSLRTMRPEDFLVKFILREAERASKVNGIVVNSFENLEGPVLKAIQQILPPVYAIGPLSLLSQQLIRSLLADLGSSLWKEDESCLNWLDSRRKPGAVIYVNFGSITVMTNEHLVEFAWGLASTDYDFVWIIRPDLVKGETAILLEEFFKEVEDRGKLANWCPLEKVLAHPSVDGFFTHSGWNSTIESISGGVPMFCWPFSGDQKTNCHYACAEWGIGMEIDGDVEREKVRSLILELMEGEKGKDMKMTAMAWKDRAVDAAMPGGGSSDILQELVRMLQVPISSSA